MVATSIRRIGLIALAAMASTLTVKPVIGAEPGEELKSIRELLYKIDQRMENQNNIAMQMLDRLKADFGQLKGDMSRLRDDMAKLQREVADVRARTGGNTSSSYYGGSAPAAPSATAAVKLVNSYVSDMSAVINGSLYVVGPGQSRVVALYPGSVNYQVLQTQGVPKSTVLQSGEMLTLSLYPRP